MRSLILVAFLVPIACGVVWAQGGPPEGVPNQFVPRSQTADPSTPMPQETGDAQAAPDLLPESDAVPREVPLLPLSTTKAEASESRADPGHASTPPAPNENTVANSARTPPSASTRRKQFTKRASRRQERAKIARSHARHGSHVYLQGRRNKHSRRSHHTYLEKSLHRQRTDHHRHHRGVVYEYVEYW
jgi:hypothetical protein